jgi:hypothetical protein
VGPLPEASFHRWLESTLSCPRCDVCYNLVVPWDDATDRFFEEQSQGPLRMLLKAIQMAHASGHAVSHYESAGVTVRSFIRPEAKP